MHQVQSSVFLAYWGAKLDAEQREVCGQADTFLTSAKGGFALKFKRKLCLVVMAVGNGLDFFRDGIDWMRAHGITALVFYFRQHSPTSGLLKYCKGRRWISRDRYKDGEPAYLGMIRINNRRLRHG